MNYTPAYIIAQYLIGQNLLIDPTTTAADWKVYTGFFPDGDEVKDRAVASMDTTPLLDGRYMSTGENIIHYGNQLLLRANDHNIGWAKMVTLEESLETVNRVTVTIPAVPPIPESKYRVDNITFTTGVIALGQDSSKRRELFSLNFLITLKEI